MAAQFDDLLSKWQAADCAACKAECTANVALNLHLQGLAAAPPAAMVATAKQKRQEARRALAELYEALRETRCALPLL
jgi:hypothetical protein